MRNSPWNIGPISAGRTGATQLARGLAVAVLLAGLWSLAGCSRPTPVGPEAPNAPAEGQADVPAPTDGAGEADAPAPSGPGGFVGDELPPPPAVPREPRPELTSESYPPVYEPYDPYPEDPENGDAAEDAAADATETPEAGG